MKNLKMRSKLIIIAIVTSLVPIVVISYLSFNNAYSELDMSVRTANARISEQVIDELTSFFEERMDDGILASMSDNLIYSIGTFNGMIPKSNEERQAAYEKMDAYLSVFMEQGNYTDVYVTNEFGKVAYSATMKEELENASLGSRFYVNNALKGNQSWSNLHYNDYIGDNMMVVTTPLVLNEGAKAEGTISLLFDQPKLDAIVHNNIDTLGATANAYLIDDEGMLLTNMRSGVNAENAALNVKVESTRIAELLPEIVKGNTEYHYSGTYLNYDGTEVIGTMTVVPIGDYYAGFILEVEEQEVYASIDELGTQALMLTLAFVAIALLLMLLMARSITKPMAAVIAYTEKIASYDISEDVPQKYLGRRDEVGSIAKSVEHVTVSLRELISKVAETSQNMTASSEQVTSITAQFAVASGEVATTIGDIAAGATNQAESTMEGTDRLFELGAVIAEDKEHISSMNQAADAVGSLVESGLVIIEELSEKTHANNEAAGAVSESIKKTNQSTNEIADASKMIADIAEQTNLLALNAAIEAARAGEQGKGFAVVAEEIRKLAEQSTESTKNIDVMVQQLRTDANLAVEKMTEASQIVAEQEESVAKTAEQFKMISQAMETANSAVAILNRASELMKEKNESVQEVMESLSAVAQENAASTEETSAAVEEQTASIDEIANASEHLAELATQLQEQITAFKL